MRYSVQMISVATLEDMVVAYQCVQKLAGCQCRWCPSCFKWPGPRTAEVVEVGRR